MKKQYTLLFVMAFFSLLTLNAQRYVTPLFTGVTKTTTFYGQNFTVLTLPVTGHTLRLPLECDIYQPTGDTARNRPVMIMIPTGDFLPKSVRQSPFGDRTDSVVVEMCTRFAKLGYVSMAIDYRLGWNPIASQQTDRIYGLINAAYRGIQDGRTAVRYLKANATALKIDTTRIMVIGEGTGGNIALGMAGLDKYSKILTTQYPQGKFTISAGGNVIPMIIEAYNGNVNGTAPDTATRSPAGYPYPTGDTLHVANYRANTSNYRLTVHMSGAMGDITWLDAASTPIISIAAPYDPTLPYRDGVSGVPIGNGVSLPVVQLQGSHWIALKADSIGINNAFKKLTAAYDPYKSLVATRNAAYGYGATYASGLFPIIGRNSIGDYAPYRWWSKDTTIASNKYGLDSASLANNPGMSATKARLYIDSIMTFIVPRACAGMALPCAGVVTGTEELLNAATTKLSIAPNPSHSIVTFESEVYNPIQAIEVYNMAGQVVQSVRNINSFQYQLQRNGLPTGVYITKVKFEGGVLSRKIVFE